MLAQDCILCLHCIRKASKFISITTETGMNNHISVIDPAHNDGTPMDNSEEARVINGVEKTYIQAINKIEAKNAKSTYSHSITETDYSGGYVYETKVYKDYYPQKQSTRSNHRGSLYSVGDVNTITPSVPKHVIGVEYTKSKKGPKILTNIIIRQDETYRPAPIIPKLK